MDAMKRGLGLDVIEVKKDEMLGKLKKNRDQHLTDYKKAMVGYQHEVIKELGELRDRAIAGFLIKTHITFDQPVSHEDEYNTVIEMLEMSVAETISITRDQFKCYVQDQWQWKRSFIDNITKYAN